MHGIYCLTDRDEIVYVGKTSNLKRRRLSHQPKYPDFKFVVLHSFGYDTNWTKLWGVKLSVVLTRLERTYQVRLRPRCNGPLTYVPLKKSINTGRLPKELAKLM